MKIRPAKKRLIHSALAVSTFCLLGAPVLGASALTYQSNVGVNFTFNSSINLSLSSANLVISNLTPGNSSDSNIITVTVATNNANGYTLNSSVGSNTLGNTNSAIYNTRKLIHTTYTSSDNSAIAAGTGTKPTFSSIDYGSSLASLTSDDTWGYSYSTDTGTTWSNYSGLPLYSDTEHVAKLKETTAPSATAGDGVDFKIAAKASGGQTSGEYNNVINFTVVGTPDPMTLAASYAAAGKTKYNGYYKLQDMTTSICSNVEVADDKLQVIDIRDDEVYLIGKLADGNCWMLDNLRLDPANSTTLANITESTTNASATSLNYFKNGGGTTSDKYPTAKINNEVWTSNSQNYYSIPMTVSSGNGWTKDTTTTSYGAGSGKIGVYYNYCAASAGSYCYGDGRAQGTSSGDATEDLCPAWWHMPTGGSSGDFQKLHNKYNTTQTATNVNSLQYNFSLPLSGNFYSGSTYNSQGNYGYWWSSTRGDNNVMYRLSVSASGVYPAETYNRYRGYSIRCIAQ